MISANVARCQSDLAKEQLILLQTDGILKAVEKMIDEAISCGRTSMYLPCTKNVQKKLFSKLENFSKKKAIIMLLHMTHMIEKLSQDCSFLGQ